MYVCICKAVSDKDIRNAVASGVRTFAQLQTVTGCSTVCGCCRPEAKRLFKLFVHEQQVLEAPVQQVA